MDFVLSTQELNQLIGKTYSSIPVKPSIPILGNFLIEASNNQIILTASDLSLSVRCDTAGDVLQEGGTTINAKTLSQLTRELTAPTIKFSTQNNVTTIISGTSKFKIPGTAPENYPSMPIIENSKTFTLQQSDLKDLIFRTSFAVAKEENRYALTGALMEIHNTMIIFFGTDGKRLARAFRNIDLDSSLFGRYIIPYKAIEEVFKNLGEEGEVKISLTEDKIAFEMNNSLVVSKLLSGDYPDFSRIIPAKANDCVRLNKEELSSLLRQIALFREDGSRSVRFSFTKGELQLSGNTAVIGEGKVTTPIDYHGPDFNVAYHPGYVLDALRHCKNETITMGLVDAFNPGVITDQEELGDCLEATPLFMIMPMRLAEMN